MASGGAAVQNPSGTGINPWWRYQEQSLPGGDNLMVNVGTGNLIVQSNDLNVPHKGVALAFRRTYNSQSLHDVHGTDGGPPGLYGNGWTNNFDARLVATSDTTTSVYDVDGARYDYALPGGWTGAAGSQAISLTAGQHATLTFDGACGWQWGKKSGTIYYFYIPAALSSCPSFSQYSSYGGLLYQIVGRNHNDTISLTYAWDNGFSGPGGKISRIVAATESGASVTLNFADFNSNRLLMSVTRPDGLQVTYGYGGLLNMKTITSPANNAAGTPVVKFYGYGAYPNANPSGVMNYVGSPRWNNSSGGDGSRLQIGYTTSGFDNSHTMLSEIDHIGFVDPTPADGTGVSIQAAPANGSASGSVPFLSEYYALGSPGAAATPTYRDTDGHYTNWVTDASNRPTQTQECTATVNQQCTGTLLVSGEQWDANDNLTASIDQRGYETDYQYDGNGNTTAIGEPSTTTSAGVARPTKLFDYDQYNNVVAYCDEVASHAMHAEFPMATTTSDSLCSSQAGATPHTRLTYTPTAAEPFGELTSITSPLGYTKRFTYDPASQGGTDYGLPTEVTGDPLSQIDGTTRQPDQRFVYDTAGDLVCYGNNGSDSGSMWLLTYDVLGRLTAAGDPDDASLRTSSCAKTTSLPGSSIVTRHTYYPDGSIASTQSPSEAAKGVSTSFSYDLDGSGAGTRR